MTQHFAASWLQSLEKKLEALSEWTWASDQNGECTMHRNLFRECFNPKFQKTLALVDDAKRTTFLAGIQKNLYKFDGRSQQFPLACLCALLQHGKASPKTEEKIAAWIGFLLDKLRKTIGSEVVIEVVEECSSAPFQRFAALMEGKLMDRLCDGLGEHLVKCDEETQKKILETFQSVPTRIEKIMRTCTKELNEWLESAPRFPSTPLMLSDTLSKMQHPLLRFFNRIKDANVKESFLVSVALALQGLRSRFRWMRALEPELETMGSDIQGRLFFVEGQGAVMEMWLVSRLKKYNSQVTSKVAQMLTADPSKAQMLKSRLQPLFPERTAANPDSGWVTLDGSSNLADALLSFLVENDSSFFCPQHTMARETLMSVLQRFGSVFEIDVQHSRVRVLQIEPPVMHPPPFGDPSLAPPPPQMSPPQMSPPPLGASKPPVMVPPPMSTGMSQAFELPQSSPQAPIITLPGESASSGADNLVDLLLHEALEPVAPEIRSKISKLAHGVYRFGEKEVTLHTQSGRLFVHRVGMMVRNCPLKTLLEEEGLTAAPAPPAGPPPLALLAAAAAPATSTGAVDASSVASIVAAVSRISAGWQTTTSTTQQNTLPFTQKSDPRELMSKRVEAATRAMNVSKQIVRRSVNFDDEKFLRRLLAKGLKHDRALNAAYEEFLRSKGIKDFDRKQDRDTVATFLERNLASSINADWARKIINSADDEEEAEKRAQKKEKKAQRKQDKKEKKKRKVSDSGSSSPEKELPADSAVAQAAAPPFMQPPSSQPPVMRPPSMPPPPSMEMGMRMPMFSPGMPVGMGGMMGQMGMGGMVPPFGPGMMGDGMPEAFEEAKKQKKDKKDKKHRKG